jgi:dephospho-CoA kinase
MIVGIAGKIASGKSTLARALAARLGAKHLGFGDYVRATAQSRGLDHTDRLTLQNLGQQLVTDDPAAFVCGILSWADYKSAHRPIIFDGVRHNVVWEQIMEFARRNGDNAILVYLDMPESRRQARLAARGLDKEAASAFDQHSSEREIDTHLQSAVNLRLNAELDTIELAEAVLRACGK